MGLFLETLQRSPLNAHQRTVLGQRPRGVGATAEMLTTLLDYSRLEAGVVKVRPAPFAVHAAVLGAGAGVGAQADASALVYRTRETSAAALADSSLVDLVMRNLISNALRYTHQGGVLDCRRRRAWAPWRWRCGTPARAYRRSRPKKSSASSTSWATPSATGAKAWTWAWPSSNGWPQK